LQRDDRRHAHRRPARLEHGITHRQLLDDNPVGFVVVVGAAAGRVRRTVHRARPRIAGPQTHDARPTAQAAPFQYASLASAQTMYCPIVQTVVGEAVIAPRSLLVAGGVAPAGVQLPGVAAGAPVAARGGGSGGSVLLHPGTLMSMSSGGGSLAPIPSSGGALLHPGGGLVCVVASSVIAVSMPVEGRRARARSTGV